MDDHYSGKGSNNRGGDIRYRHHDRPYNDRDDQRHHTRDFLEQPPSSALDEFGRDIKDAHGDNSDISKAPGARQDVEKGHSPPKQSRRDFPRDIPHKEFKDDHYPEHDRRHRSRDGKREEQGIDHFQRPSREPVSYRNANPPSSILLFSGIPVTVTEDFVRSK